MCLWSFDVQGLQDQRDNEETRLFRKLEAEASGRTRNYIDTVYSHGCQGLPGSALYGEHNSTRMSRGRRHGRQQCPLHKLPKFRGS